MLSKTLEKKTNAGRISVVDDEQDIVIIIGKVLRKSGYEITIERQ
jgi:CheY-like chemotaxis protein